MSGFNAETAVTPLDWDFTKYAGENAKGTTPEPSTQTIERFFRRQQTLSMAVVRTKQAMGRVLKEKAESLSPEEALQEMRRQASLTIEEAFDEIVDELNKVMSEGEMEKFSNQMAELVAEASNNCPTAEQIMSLPYRLRIAYFGWFTQEMNSPEAYAVGTNTLPVRLNGAGLGI